MLLFTGMELPTGTDDARDAFDAAVGEVAVVTADAPPPSRPAGPPQRSLSDALLLGLETPTPRWSPSPTELDFLTSTLVPAADGWAQGTAGYGELSRLAGAIGYAVEPVSGCGEGGCVLLSSPEGGPTLVLRAGGTPVSVVASRPRTEAGTLALALGAFESLGAEVLLIDPAAEVTPVEPTRDPMQALHFGWRRTLEGREGARTLWFRGQIGRAHV